MTECRCNEGNIWQKDGGRRSWRWETLEKGNATMDVKVQVCLSGSTSEEHGGLYKTSWRLGGFVERWRHGETRREDWCFSVFCNRPIMKRHYKDIIYCTEDESPPHRYTNACMRIFIPKLYIHLQTYWHKLCSENTLYWDRADNPSDVLNNNGSGLQKLAANTHGRRWQRRMLRFPLLSFNMQAV